MFQSITMFLLFLCIACVLGWVVFRLQYTHTFKTPPTYSSWLPMIGHLHLIVLLDQVRMWNFYKKLCQESVKKGGVIIFSLGTDDRYFITDPDDAYTTAHACLEKHHTYNIAKPWLGDGLLTADVPTWKAHRKIINLAFGQQVLNGMLSVFNSQSRRLQKQFQENIGQKFNPEPVLLNLNLETICKTSLAVDATENKDLFDEYVKSLRGIFNAMFERFRKYWLHSDFVFYFSSLKRQQDKIINGLHKLSNTALEKRKSIIMASKDRQPPTDEFRPIIDTILGLSIEKRLLTDKQVREHLDTIIFGGHDTTATSLTYTLVLLGSDQERQERVHKEILEVMGDSQRDVEKEDLLKLVYLESVIKESLRLYPIAPIFPRVARTDLKLKNYTLPAGSTCLIDVWSVHRHAIWGPDAEEFRPERWQEPNTLPDVHKAFSPFGVGRRTCIGKIYAIMSMKVILVYLLRRYKVTADINKLTLKMDSLLRPDSGSDITIELRK